MATNSNPHRSVVTAERSPLSYTSSSLRGAPGSRRERLRSFARATSQVIKQEISKYYDTLPANNDDHASVKDNDSISSKPRSTVESTRPLPPSRPGVVRTRTQSMDDLEPSNSSSTSTITPDSGKPHCMLFPTYACKTIDNDNQTIWRVRLAGWTFALPGSSRIERWILAAGRTYGGLSANSAEDVHFARLLNQFRCQTMRSVDLLLSVVDVIPVDRALVYQHHSSSSSSSSPSSSSTSSLSDTATDTTPAITTSTPSHHKSPFSLHHIRDKATDALKAFMINSGPTGRFEHLLTLDLSHTIHDATRKMLRLKASFGNRLDATHHDGYVDLIEPEGISIISDIDDTIKITGILDGKDTILQNTFFRKADQVPGMSEVYRKWVDLGAHVHYVSNSPWQVYPALSEFLHDQQFPPGSMHLRAVSTGDLIRRKAAQHKLDVIPQIIQDFPKRKFILVGDSGERDPEIYRMLYDRFPDQIIKIFIHDVTSERAKRADQRELERSDSYYNGLKRFLSREQPPGLPPRPQRSGTSTTAIMEVIGDTDIPEEEKVMEDPAVPLKTKLDIFQERMEEIAKGLPEDTFTLYTLASQLVTDAKVSSAFAQTQQPLIQL